MAKSKRSRRARRQEVEKPVQSPAAAAPQAAAPVEKKAAAAAASRKTVDFANEYYYVYAELRQILMVTGIMFVIMIGLSYFI